jgi:2'-hydroxyisoflavone reductase
VDVLLLGGSKFVGPHLIAAAQDLGARVTTFTRGLLASAPIEGVETLHGDRNRDLATLDGRRWDVVIDTSGYLPSQVRTAAEFFSSRSDRYVFFSSISVYADFSVFGIDERSPVRDLSPEQLRTAEGTDLSGPVSAVSFGENYGALKALCETQAEAAMPGRTLIVRPGLIVGPGDNTDRFSYWVVRASGGGDVLAPGRPERELQFIDVRDLARWTLRAIEQRLTGIYNLNGLPGGVTMLQVLEAGKAASGSDARFVWVADEFLMEYGVTPWSEIPVWVPEYDSQDSRGFMFVNVDKALAAGLTLRPLDETVRDTLEWWRSAPPRALRAGLDPAKEAGILEKWKHSEKLEVRSEKLVNAGPSQHWRSHNARIAFLTLSSYHSRTQRDYGQACQPLKRVV